MVRIEMQCEKTECTCPGIVIGVLLAIFSWELLSGQQHDHPGPAYPADGGLYEMPSVAIMVVYKRM